jgi:hypothetical protein
MTIIRFRVDFQTWQQLYPYHNLNCLLENYKFGIKSLKIFNHLCLVYFLISSVTKMGKNKIKPMFLIETIIRSVNIHSYTFWEVKIAKILLSPIQCQKGKL